MNRPRVILAQFNVLAQGVKDSIVIDSSDQKLKLDGDQASPGNNKVYGTDGSGNKTWKSDSSSIADNSITNAKLVNVSQATIKGRAAAGGTGSPQDLTASQVKTILSYAGTEVSNTPAGNIAATSVQAAINELDTEKQPLDSDLTAIAGLTPSNDDLVQRKSGVWTNRTPAQFKTDLSLTKSDVGLGSVDNTSDVNKPVSTAQATAIALKVSKSGDSMSGALNMSSNKITSLANGTNSGDAVNKSQLDGKLSLSGGTMTGDIAMGSHKITGLANGTSSTDAATVGQLPSLSVSSVAIGDWNMSSTPSVTVAHGLSDHKKISNIFVRIRDDADTNYYSLFRSGYVAYWDSEFIYLNRSTGVFDTTDFDATSYNRGHVFIQTES